MPTATHNRRRVQLDRAKIKQLREAAGWSMEQAAAKAGLLAGRQHWQAIESGKKEPRLATITAMAKALGVPPKDLLK